MKFVLWDKMKLPAKNNIGGYATLYPPYFSYISYYKKKGVYYDNNFSSTGKTSEKDKEMFFNDVKNNLSTGYSKEFINKLIDSQGAGKSDI